MNMRAEVENVPNEIVQETASITILSDGPTPTVAEREFELEKAREELAKKEIVAAREARKIELEKASKERATKMRTNPRLSIIETEKHGKISSEAQKKQAVSHFFTKNFAFWRTSEVNTVPLNRLVTGLNKKSFPNARKTYGISLLGELPNYLINLIRMLAAKGYASLYLAPGSCQKPDGLSDGARRMTSVTLLNAYKKAKASDSKLVRALASSLILPLIVASAAKAVAFPALSLAMNGLNATTLVGNSVFTATSEGIYKALFKPEETETIDSTKSISAKLCDLSIASTTKGSSATSSREGSILGRKDSRKGSIVESTTSEHPLADSRYGLMHHEEPELNTDPDRVVFHADPESSESDEVIFHSDDENEGEGESKGMHR